MMPGIPFSFPAPAGQILEAGFFNRETVSVARDLLGKVLVREVDGRHLWGRVVEVEAYLGPEDLAAHSSGGRRSPRNEVMYGGPGHAYVYFVYGCWFALNVSGERAGIGAGVLLRACEPFAGIEDMQRHRGTSRLLDLARGLALGLCEELVFGLGRCDPRELADRGEA